MSNKPVGNALATVTLDIAYLGDVSEEGIQKILNQALDRLETSSMFTGGQENLIIDGMKRTVTVQAFPAPTPEEIIEHIRDILWPGNNPNHEWNPQTLDDVAEAMAGYRP